jgi:transcriptional regulator
MYTPSAFRHDSLPELHEHILATRLAILVSQGPDGFEASHVPLLLEPDAGEFGTLHGHLARANPQWRALAAGEVMVIFPGVDAYISPGFYAAKAEHGKVVPTWNYEAVHAHGQADVFTDAQRLLQIVSGLTDRHEARQPQPWSVNDAPADYIDGMLKAVVGFSIPIARLLGKRKLGQNRSAADIQGVKTGLSASTDPGDQALAAAMKNL